MLSILLKRGGDIILKDINKRLKQLDAIIQDKKDYTLVIAFKNEIDNNFFIQYYDKGNKTEYIYDKIEDFYRDKSINPKDKKTFIRIFSVVKNRTAEDIDYE